MKPVRSHSSPTGVEVEGLQGMGEGQREVVQGPRPFSPGLGGSVAAGTEQ